MNPYVALHENLLSCVVDPPATSFRSHLQFRIGKFRRLEPLARYFVQTSDDCGADWQPRRPAPKESARRLTLARMAHRQVHLP